MFAGSAVPNPHTGHAILPMHYVTYMQLHLRLPLSVLRGVTRCTCGAQLDVFGDHVLSCSKFQQLRTPWHDLVQDTVASMVRCANFHVSVDARRDRAISRAYSPNWRPDLTLLHGSEQGSHVINDTDATTTPVVAQTCLPGSARHALLASDGSAVSKRGVYGNVAPHEMLPFVVESAGALGKEAMKLFQRCRKRAENQLSPQLDEVSTWSARGFSNYFLASFSVATAKGLGHLYMAAACTLRAH